MFAMRVTLTLDVDFHIRPKLEAKLTGERLGQYTYRIARFPEETTTFEEYKSMKNCSAFIETHGLY